MCLISDERLATDGVDGHEDGDDGNALAKDSRGNDGRLWRENALLLVAVLLTGLHFRTVTRTRELGSENRSKRPRERCFKLGRSTAKLVIVPYKQECEPTSKKKSGECGAARKSSTDRSAWIT